MLTWILGLLLVNPTEPDHAIYLSLIEIEQQDGKTEMVVKVFADDLQDAIRNMDGSLEIESETLFVQNNYDLVSSYFANHLQLTNTRDSIGYKLTEGELVGDSYQVKFIFEMPWQKLSIKANYFMELFPTQQNIVIVTSNGLKRSCRLNLQESGCKVSF